LRKIFSPIQTARALRQQMTFSEIMLWHELRGRSFNGYKFRRQHPIVYDQIGRRKYFYVADFYCAFYKAVIELDGKIHEFEGQRQYDDARNIVMNELGYKVLRVQNEEVERMNNLLKKIENFLIE
jgi:very-short-patch-repair endonuclease